MNIYFLGLIIRTTLGLILYYSTISLIQHKKEHIIITSQPVKNNKIKKLSLLALMFLINIRQKLIKN